MEHFWSFLLPASAQHKPREEKERVVWESWDVKMVTSAFPNRASAMASGIAMMAWMSMFANFAKEFIGKKNKNKNLKKNYLFTRVPKKICIWILFSDHIEGNM